MEEMPNLGKDIFKIKVKEHQEHSNDNIRPSKKWASLKNKNSQFYEKTRGNEYSYILIYSSDIVASPAGCWTIGKKI